MASDDADVNRRTFHRSPIDVRIPKLRHGVQAVLKRSELPAYHIDTALRHAYARSDSISEASPRSKIARSRSPFPAHDERLWSHYDWGNWRNRVFKPAARSVGLEQARPYDLRHSFCSLLIHECATVVEIARQLGHSPTMTLNAYGHVFDELQGTERLSAEEQIRQARARHVSVLCPREPAALEEQEEEEEHSLQTSDGRSWTRTRDLLLIREAL